MLVDSHCHLEYKGLVEDREGVLARARAAGVGAFLNISTRQSEWEQVVGTAVREPDVFASVGIHPHEADAHQDLGRAALLEATRHPKVVAIGETGLDYYYDKSDRDAQKSLFRMHIDVARETQLPLIIHTRDAEDDTHAILAEEMGKGAYPALIHCFTASAAFANKVLALGLTISLSGIVTFKNAKELQEVAKIIPLDKLLVETDSPFLAPVPHRGRVCEPAYVADTAAFVAGLRGTDVEHLKQVTTANFFNLWARAARAYVEWGFSAFERRQLFAPGAVVGEARVQGGDAREVALKAAGRLAINLPKGSNSPLSATIRYEGPLRAPIAAGQQVAVLEVTAEGVAPARIPLYAAEAVGTAGPLDRIVNAALGLFS